MDKLKALGVFIEVAKHRRFSAAAEQLNLSAPAVTRIISNLESEMGVVLFHRNTRHVRLTESGHQFFQRTLPLLQELDEAEAEAAGNYLSPTGTLTITAPHLFGHIYILPIVMDYMVQYPNVSVRTYFADEISSMAQEELDVALRIGHLQEDSLYASAVGSVRRMVCGAPSYFKKKGYPIHPEDISNHSIIYPTTYDPSPSWLFYQNSQPKRVKISPKLFCNNKASAVQAAVNGAGLTKLFTYQVQNEFKEGLLKSVLTSYEEPPLPINLVRTEGRKSSAKVKSFVDFALKALRSNPLFGSNLTAEHTP